MKIKNKNIIKIWVIQSAIFFCMFLGSVRVADATIFPQIYTLNKTIQYVNRGLEIEEEPKHNVLEVKQLVSIDFKQDKIEEVTQESKEHNQAQQSNHDSRVLDSNHPEDKSDGEEVKQNEVKQNEVKQNEVKQNEVNHGKVEESFELESDDLESDMIESDDIESELVGLEEETFVSASEEVFLSMDEEGNITYIPFDEVEILEEDALDDIAIEVIPQESSRTTYGVSAISTTSISYGVVIFNDRDGSSTTSYVDAETGAAGYTNGLYGPDAAYLGVEDGKVKFKLSGVIGLVDSSKVTVVEYDDFIASGKITSAYKVTNGRIYHQITTNLTSYASTQMFGYQPSYLENDKTYYSYDGHYFYATYKKMVKDYVNGTYKNSLNASDPYYNYYLYLSHRSSTSFTASQLNSYLSSKTSNANSKMLKTGADFISAQNTYGANAILMFGLAMNESSYGSSNIAQTKNNLFGHGAVDSNPYYGSSGYDTVADCITYHAEYFVSRQYLDIDGDSRSYGPHLGNKRSGMNIKYASDPYWGEKAAAHCFLIEDVDTETIADYNNYKIGIVGGKIPVYNSPDGTILYYAKNKNFSNTYNMPVIILGTVVNNGESWYKIQSDMPILSARTGVLFSQRYSFSKDYAYVKQSNVQIVNEVTENNNSNSSETTTYMLGDVSGDSQITSLDYILVKNHIMGTSILKGDYLLAADTSGDGSVTSLDYIQIKNHIMGVTLIK